MTVKDLIEELQRYPDDLPVLIDSECCAELNDIRHVTRMVLESWKSRREALVLSTNEPRFYADKED